MPRLTPDEEHELIERVESGDDDPDTWEELPPLSSDAPSPPTRLGAVLSVRLIQTWPRHCRARPNVAAAPPATPSDTPHWRGN